jgi:hypothetical protein
VLFPKVTVDVEEYIKHCIRSNMVESIHVKAILSTVVACYFDNMVWLKKLSAFNLLHEYTHHVIRTILRYPIYGNLTLFSDFMDTSFDITWGLIRHSDWREHIWECIDMVKEAWKMFTYFIRCKDE